VSEQSLDHILEVVVERTTEILDADRATLYVIDTDQKKMWSRVVQGNDVQRIELEIGQGIAGWAALHGRTVNVKDAYLDARFNPEVDRASQYRTRSILCQPLRSTRQQVIGVIQVLNKKHGYFGTDDEDLLAAIASQAATSIQSAQLYLDIVKKNIDLLETQLLLKERQEELELLFGIERRAAMARTGPQALTSVLGQTLEEFPSEAAALVIVDPDQDRFTYGCTDGAAAGRLHELPVGVAPPVLRRVLEAGEPFVFPASTSEELTSALARLAPPWPLRSFAALPAFHQGEGLGCLVLMNRLDDPRGYSEHDLRVLRLIANRMALSVVLARAQEEQETALRLSTIGQALSSVIHDLRTPLTLIGGYAQLMVNEADPAARKQHREQVKRQIENMGGMTQEVLAFARGESTLLARKVLLPGFLSEITEALHHELHQTGVDLEVDARYRGAVRMDEPKIKRVIFNLARNAKEAMPRGGRFTIQVDEAPGQVILRFSDTGPGIPEELEGKLFDPFVTYGKPNGTGLGLAIVKKIVDEHRGTIRVESKLGEGTTFTIALPQGEAGAA
jgi:signal transduction histidine kinase/putative methionine-R-sulfoxide reductase with GAF domain